MAERDNGGRVPPQAINAEQAVLGAILLAGNKAMDTAVIYLWKDTFYRSSHDKIFAAMLELYNKEQEIDLITVSAELERIGELESIGGRSYLADLSTSVAPAAN